MEHNIPNTLLELLQLSLILIFLTTTIAATISVFITKRNGLIYLSSQAACLFYFLGAAKAWIYPLAFDAIFDSVDAYAHFVQTLSVMAVAFGLDVAMKMFVWDGRYFKRGGAGVPGILVHVVQGLIYLTAIVIILQFVFGESITAIATLSGAAALILGLSAQATLGEMFAGLAISISRPFKVGDWIKVGSEEEGQVIDQTWRHVVIRLRDHSVVNVNNSVIAGHPIRNFTSPKEKIRLSETVFIDHTNDPYIVQQVLSEAISSSQAALVDPPPAVFFRGANEYGKCEYLIAYSVLDYGKKPLVKDAIWKVLVETVRIQNLGIITGP